MLIKAIIIYINELVKKITIKEFLYKKLKEILSCVSKKYTNVLAIKNKKLIGYLLNLKEKGEYFQKLFDLSFLDFLEHINGKKNNELLDGFPTIDKIIKNEMKKLRNFDINKLKSCFENYKDLVERRRSRKSKNNKKEI